MFSTGFLFRSKRHAFHVSLVLGKQKGLSFRLHSSRKAVFERSIGVHSGRREATRRSSGSSARSLGGEDFALQWPAEAQPRREAWPRESGATR